MTITRRRYAVAGKWHREGGVDIDPGQTLLPTTIVLSMSPASPATSGATETFTGTVSPAAADGTVQFFNGGALVGTGTISGGVATITAVLADGAHSLTAIYVPSGTSAYSSSTSSAVSYTVNGAATATSTVLTVSPASPASAGSTETLTATLTPSGAVGSVQFYDGATAIGAPVAVAAGTAVKTTTLAPASRTLNATFTPSNPAVYKASTAPGVSYTVSSGGGGGGSSYIGKVKVGISGVNTDNSEATFEGTETTAGTTWGVRRTYTGGQAPSNFNATPAWTDVGKRASMWSFKPGTPWSGALLVGSSDASTTLNCLKTVPTTHQVYLTAHHEPDGGGGTTPPYQDDTPATFGPMQVRLRALVDQANTYRKGLNPNALPILLGGILMEFSLERTDPPQTGPAWIDNWYPGNGIWDFFGWDSYTRGNPPRTPDSILGLAYSYSRTRPGHDVLPILIGETGVVAALNTTTRQQWLKDLGDWCLAREVIAVAYFNHDKAHGGTDNYTFLNNAEYQAWGSKAGSGGVGR